MLNVQVVRGYTLKALRDYERLKRIVRHPQLEFAGKRHLAALRLRSSSKLRIDPHTGWTRFDTRSFASGYGTCKKLRMLGAQWSSKEDPERHEGRGFPINMLVSSDLRAHPEILDLALCEEFLLAASEYLGQVPSLFNLALWWSPPTETLDGSRQFHFDHRDGRQVKIFVNLNDVGEDSGPLHFLPADTSDRFNAKIGYTQKKIPDDVVYSICSRDEVFDNCGEAGTGVMVDTGRCLHYGSRKNSRDRLLLMISYARPNCTMPNECITLDPVREELAQQLYNLDPVRKYALTVRPLD